MNKETLDLKLIKLEREFENKKKSIIREYCNAHNTYKVGDKFTDHIGTVVIEEIQYSYGGSFGNPCCVYFGTELKKDGTPKKIMSKRKAWQLNDITEKIEEV